MRRRHVVVSVVFYVALGAVVAGVLLVVLDDVLPRRIATRIGFNSEGLLLALLIAAWIQFARPRLAGTRREWAVTGAVAAACVALAVLLLMTDFPSRFKTLNETFLAAALLIPYLQLHRRPSPRIAALLSLGVLAVMVLGGRTEIVTDLAEMLGALLLAPLAFDAVDRGILDPQARTSRALRYAWYAALVVVPVTLSVLQHGQVFSGPAGDVTRYGVRLHESFVFILLVELYFAVALGRRGASATRDEAVTAHR